MLFNGCEILNEGGDWMFGQSVMNCNSSLASLRPSNQPTWDAAAGRILAQRQNTMQLSNTLCLAWTGPSTGPAAELSGFTRIYSLESLHCSRDCTVWASRPARPCCGYWARLLTWPAWRGSSCGQCWGGRGMAAGGAGGGHRLVRSAAVYRCSEAAAALGLLLSPAGRRHHPPHIAIISTV